MFELRGVGHLTATSHLSKERQAFNGDGEAALYVKNFIHGWGMNVQNKYMASLIC
jgi:hypothetical protein